MQKITHQALTDLTKITQGPAVTIYIPLEASASPPHITENQIRFKNLIHKAVEMLKARGDDSKLPKQLCAKLDEVYNDLEFWKQATRGSLLICATPGALTIYRLPVDTEEYVAVDDTFYLAPIVALIGDAKEFYLLALAQQNPKVYKGDIYDLEEVQIGLPANLWAGLGIDELSQQSEHQGSATGSSLKTAWYNGRGGLHDTLDNDRLKFFHIIDAKLNHKLDRTLPLILSGTEAEVAEFRALSKYPTILQGTICGNHTETNPAELFESAHHIIMHELIEPDHAVAREEYERLRGANPERVAGDAVSIVAAAEQGRIDKLLAIMSRQTTDTVQDKVTAVLRISFPDGDASILLNNLAVKVWQMSGRVINLIPEEMPGNGPMVARLRY